MKNRPKFSFLCWCDYNTGSNRFMHLSIHLSVFLSINSLILCIYPAFLSFFPSIFQLLFFSYLFSFSFLLSFFYLLFHRSMFPSYSIERCPGGNYLSSRSLSQQQQFGSIVTKYSCRNGRTHTHTQSCLARWPCIWCRALLKDWRHWEERKRCVLSLFFLVWMWPLLNPQSGTFNPPVAVALITQTLFNECTNRVGRVHIPELQHRSPQTPKREASARRFVLTWGCEQRRQHDTLHTTFCGRIAKRKARSPVSRLAPSAE